MIACVRGSLHHMLEDSVVVLTPGGVGYEVHLNAKTLMHLPENGDEVFFHTAAVHAENQPPKLCGFVTLEERESFLVLTSISGVGPKVAQAVLSRFSPDELFEIAAGDDPAPLSTVSGVGKKSAEKIFVDLKYKLKANGAVVSPKKAAILAKPHGPKTDALSALQNLGWSDAEAQSAVAAVFAEEPDLDASAAIRAALKHLAKSRG